jgi:hypothetical protein
VLAALTALAALALLLSEENCRQQENAEQKTVAYSHSGTPCRLVYGVTPSLEPAPTFYPCCHEHGSRVAVRASVLCPCPFYNNDVADFHRRLGPTLARDNRRSAHLKAQFSTRPVSAFFTSI